MIDEKDLIPNSQRIPFYSNALINIQPGKADELREDSTISLTPKVSIKGIEYEIPGSMMYLRNGINHWVFSMLISSVNTKVIFEDELKSNIEHFVEDVVISPHDDKIILTVYFNKIDVDRKFVMRLES